VVAAINLPESAHTADLPGFPALLTGYSPQTLAAAHSVHMAACHANKQERSPQGTTVKLSPDRQIRSFWSGPTGPREHQRNRAEVLGDIRHLQTVGADSVPGV
jgi:hypothetical protein